MRIPHLISSDASSRIVHVSMCACVRVSKVRATRSAGPNSSAIVRAPGSKPRFDATPFVSCRTASSSSSLSSITTPSSKSGKSRRAKRAARGRGSTIGRRGRHLWEPPSQAAPACRGLLGKPCTLALDGSGRPGAATTSDAGCVFCSAARFEQLKNTRRGGLATSYLLRLPQAFREEALQRIKLHGGKQLQKDFELRVDRREQRTRDSRPRRGVRGQYKRKHLGDAWGLAEKTEKIESRGQEAEPKLADKRDKSEKAKKKDKKRKHKDD